MANVYGVTADKVAAEIPGLMPSGFSSASKPAQSIVEAWIATADARVQLAVAITAGTPPEVTDKAALLAVRYIINYTLANVVRAVYAGRQPQDVQAAAKAYSDEANALMADLVSLGAAIVGDGTAGNTSRVRGDMGDGYMADRALLVDDRQLDANAGPLQGRW